MTTTDNPPQFGGSFAPPLDAAGVARYRTLAETRAGPAVLGRMLELCDLAERYLGSAAGGPQEGRAEPHPSGRGLVRRLPDDVVESLDPHVPWPRELKELAALFDTIDPVAQKGLRDAAHHLLWYAAELALDRHPITTDTLHL